MRISDWSSDVCSSDLLGDGTPNGGLLVFEAQVQLAASYPPAPAAQRLVNGLQLPQIHQPGQLYAHGMFHGPRLQGCTRIDGHSSEGMVAELTTLPTHDYFAGIATPRLQFDAALLDAAGQLAGFWLRERDRKSTRLNSSHYCATRMPSSACKKKTLRLLQTNQQLKQHKK